MTSYIVEVIFVLIESEDDRNVGSVARALTTMGYPNLRLVRPLCDHLSERAFALAHGSAKVLKDAEIFNSLEEATADCEIRVAATARHRKLALRYHDVKELPDLLAAKQTIVNRVAIVFGKESSGLSNSDLCACEIVSTIPQACTFPSLNLSQAVMVYSYILATESTKVLTKDRRLDQREVLPEEYQSLLKDIEDLCRNFKISSALFETIKKRIAILTLSDLHVVYRFKTELKAYLRRVGVIEEEND